MKKVKWFSIVFSVVIISMSCEHKQEINTKSIIQDDIPTRIKKINESFDFKHQPYLNDLRSQGMLESLKKTPNDIKLYLMTCDELVKAGKNEAAIVKLEGLLQNIKIKNYTSDQVLRAEKAILPILSSAYWRLAEQQNCLENNVFDDCIIPNSKNAQFSDIKAAEMAVSIYKRLLEIEPNNMNYIWLTNLAYMALGKYPEALEAKYLIKPENFISNRSFPRYKNIAKSLNIDVYNTAGASIIEDFNGDGHLDLFVSSWGQFGVCNLFINQGNGTFKDETSSWNLSGVTGGLNATQGDANNDGYPDIFIVRGGWLQKNILPNSLLINQKGKGFKDETISSGLYSCKPGQTAVWCDFNNDGWLDIFVGNETKSRRSDKNKLFSNELFLNQKNGTFKNVINNSGIDLYTYTKGATFSDINQDGLPDLYISCIGEDNSLYINKSKSNKLIFEKTNRSVEKPKYSFPCWFFDYNQDGYEDLFVATFCDDKSNTNFSGYMADEYLNGNVKNESSRLYINDQKGGFIDQTNNANLNTNIFAMGSNFGDLDYNGYPDMYIGTGEPNLLSIVPNRMFLNQEGQYFEDISYSGGFSSTQKGHGVSFADFDNDGDQDVHATMGGAYQGDPYYNLLYENPGNDNDWIVIKAIGVQSNKSAIGVRIEVNVTYKNGKNKSFFRTVNSGGSFGGNPFRQEIGLGSDVSKINFVKLFWPSSKTNQVFEELVKNTFYIIEENLRQPEIWDPQR